MDEQLKALAKPFNDSVVQTKPGQDGGSYVEHGVVVQKLLATVGPFDMEHVQLVHGIVPAKVNKQGEIVRDADPNGVVGCLLTCRFRIDGQDVVVTEAGDVEHPENKATNGARMKDAVSDAVKRCAMRIGVGLHLWGNSGYFLPDALTENMADPNPPQAAESNPQPEGEAEQAAEPEQPEPVKPDEPELAPAQEWVKGVVDGLDDDQKSALKDWWRQRKLPGSFAELSDGQCSQVAEQCDALAGAPV